jgi:hypothetical protein
MNVARDVGKNVLIVRQRYRSLAIRMMTGIRLSNIFRAM